MRGEPGWGTSAGILKTSGSLIARCGRRRFGEPGPGKFIVIDVAGARTACVFAGARGDDVHDAHEAEHVAW